MGTWNHSIEADDIFADVHDCFLEDYNRGMSPEVATRRVLEGFADHFADSDDTHAAHFALALAQWETQSLDAALLQKVKEIVATGANLRNWEERGASRADLAKRRVVLDDFLKKIGKPRLSRKRRQKRKQPEYTEIVLLDLPAPDGLKTVTVTEWHVDGKFIHTAAMMLWADLGGVGLFHVQRPGLELSAQWIDAQSLEVRFSNILESDLQIGPGKEREAFYCGDRVALSYRFG